MAKITRRQMERYPSYLKLLIMLKNNGEVTFSSSLIARVMKCSEEQVRKDLQAIAKTSGKPGVGRYIDETIKDLQDFLGYNQVKNAVVVGVGRLGEAFLNYFGFTNYGFHVVAGFDVSPSKVNRIIDGKPVYSLDELPGKLKELNADIAILTVPTNAAQTAVNALVKAGIKAILNFAPVHLDVNDSVAVENIDMAATLAMLSHKMQQNQSEEAAN